MFRVAWPIAGRSAHATFGFLLSGSPCSGGCSAGEAFERSRRPLGNTRTKRPSSFWTILSTETRRWLCKINIRHLPTIMKLPHIIMPPHSIITWLPIITSRANTKRRKSTLKWQSNTVKKVIASRLPPIAIRRNNKTQCASAPFAKRKKRPAVISTSGALLKPGGQSSFFDLAFLISRASSAPVRASYSISTSRRSGVRISTS
jgi:hypothetical protein